ncbi:hypothetical protein [Bradyrhizobium sp. ARR65]|nr:hypothetical protein [Bradyrhizobium sp. ARR65]
MKPVVVRNIKRADASGMDMYKMRKALARAGLVHVDHPERA